MIRLDVAEDERRLSEFKFGIWHVGRCGGVYARRTDVIDAIFESGLTSAKLNQRMGHEIDLLNDAIDGHAISKSAALLIERSLEPG